MEGGNVFEDMSKISVSQCGSIGEAEQTQSAAWNGTAPEYPQGSYVPQLVTAQALARPDALAVKSENQVLTYRDLDTRSNRLAHYLLSLGAGPEMLVALCLERSL